MKTILCLVVAGTVAASAAEPLALIPKPVSVEPSAGNFPLDATTAIRFEQELENEAKLLAADIARATGLKLRAIDARRELQDAYVANVRSKLQKTVWQNATCTAFYRKNMTEEVTALSPEPVTGFILSRKWFRLSDYRQLK